MQSNRGGFDVDIENVTGNYSGILLTGPKSREILQQMTEEDLSSEAFPWLAAREIQIDSAMVRVLRVSYAGELGYELHMPSYQLISIYDSMWRRAEACGIRNFGGYAFNSMRMEKMYRAYGNEFTEEISGLEAGMDRFIDTSRDFIGCENLKQRQQDGYAIELAYLVFDDDLPCECFGNEGVYHNGELVGLTTGGDEAAGRIGAGDRKRGRQRRGGEEVPRSTQKPVRLDPGAGRPQPQVRGVVRNGQVSGDLPHRPRRGGAVSLCQQTGLVQPGGAGVHPIVALMAAN